MEFQIRLADAKDIPDIMALQALSLRKLSQGTYNAAQIESLVRSQGAARVASFNAGEELIYSAWVHTTEKQKQDGQTQGRKEQLVAIAALINHSSQIGGLYVHPDYARQGIATQLLQQIEVAAIAQRHRVIRVMSSLVAIPFYESRGYSRLFHRTVCFEGEMVGCMEMAKALENRSLPFEIVRQFARNVIYTTLTIATVWVAFILL